MRRIHLLSGVLALSAVALPITYFVLNGKAAAPPPNAPFETKRKYYTERIKKDPSDIDAYIEFANIEDREGMFMSARRHLLAARALGAPDTRVSPILGRTLSRLAREEEAQVELEKAANLSPDSVDSVLNLAGFHVDSRRIGAARNILSAWIAAHPDYTDKAGLERLVMALVSCADDKGASQLSEKLLQLAPDDPGALTLAARTAMDNTDAAKAKGYLEKLLPIAPDQAGANYLYGLILYRQKDYDGALKAWLKANQLNPSAPDVYERIGQEYARRGDFKKAAYALDQIATVDQGYPAAYRAARACEKAGFKDDANYWDATALGLRGAFAEALVVAQKAAKSTNPKRKRRALIAVAESYRGLKKTKEYVAAIEEATKENTVDDLLLRAYAYFQAETKETLPKRLACLRKAAEMAPERRAAISIEVAEQLRRTGNRDDAEKELEAALIVAPEDPTLLKTLGSLYQDRSDNPERIRKSLELTERAVKFAPQDELAWLQLGQCYLTNNEAAKAVQCLEHVIDLEPGYGPGYLELARVYAKVGDKESNQQMMQLYTKYVSFEQKHDTLRTRARGPKAKSEDIQAYGDFLLDAGDLGGATSEYERIIGRNSKDKRTRTLLKQLYGRLGRTEQLLALEASEK